MSKRYMTDGEIVTFFRQAADPKAEIRILAELNNCCTDEIIAILHSRGIKTPRVRRYDPGGEGGRAKTSPGKFKIGRWSAQDTQTVIDMYRDGCSIEEIARKVRRTENAVMSRLRDLRKNGVETDDHKRKLAWSADEDRILLVMCRDGYGADQIAEALGRSKAAVKNRIQNLRKEGVQIEYRKKKNAGDIPY